MNQKKAILWQQIVEILRLNPNGLDTLSIRKKSNILSKESPKTLKQILYAKERTDDLINLTKHSRGKPVWKLPPRSHSQSLNQFHFNDQSVFGYQLNDQLNNQQQPIQRSVYSNNQLNKPIQHAVSYSNNNNNFNVNPPNPVMYNAAVPPQMYYHLNSPTQVTQAINPLPQRGRGRGLGRGIANIQRGRGRGRGSFIRPIIKQLVPIKEHFNPQENKLNPDVPAFLPSPNTTPIKHIHQNQLNNKNSIHTSRLISSPFRLYRKENSPDTLWLPDYYPKQIGDEYYKGYLYHIKITNDPNKCPIGILLPQPIPTFCLKHIRFPIQVPKDIEKQWKQPVDRFMEEKKTIEQDVTIDDNKFKQNCIVTLELITSKQDDMVHKLKKESFHIIQKCNQFIFQKLDQKSYKAKRKCPKLKAINIDQVIQVQDRNYLIIPLTPNKWKTNDFGIDYECIQRIYLGTKRLNAMEFRNELPYKCSLKNELVEIDTQMKSVNINQVINSKIFISYGLHKPRFNQIRQQKNKVAIRPYEMKHDDNIAIDDDLQSISSFANQSVVDRFDVIASGKKRLSQNSPLNVGKDVILVREEDPSIQNVLIAMDKGLLSDKLNSKLNNADNAKDIKNTLTQTIKLRYENNLQTVYPTGITTKCWYAFKNLPAILWWIENWFKIIDLHELLSKEIKGIKSTNSNVFLYPNMNDNDEKYPDSINNDYDTDIDLTLLFAVMHRCSSTTDMYYETYNTLGSYVLKALCTIHLFSTDANADYKQLHQQISRLTCKKSSHHSDDLLVHIANKYTILSYAILFNFDYKKWNPPQFQKRRNKYSLYDINTPFDIITDSRQKQNRHDIGAYLLQSIIGVYWVSILNKPQSTPQTNPFNNGINSTLEFLKDLGILKTHFHIADEMKTLLKNKNITLNINNKINKLKNIAITDKIEIKSNKLLIISLQTVIENCSHYSLAGITFKRLELLGDSILDLLVIWFIYCNVVDGNNKQQNEQIPDRGNKWKWKQDMTDERHNFVNDNSLGYHFIENGLDQFIEWFDVNTINNIKKYKKQLYKSNRLQLDIDHDNDNDDDDMEGSNNITNINSDNNNNKLYSAMQTQKSPGGFQENKKGKWPLKITAPKILGQLFEALLGAIFLGANNDDVFLSLKPLKPKFWNLRPCVEFLKTFLGNYENWKTFNWDKWTPNVAVSPKNILSDVV